MTYQSRGPAPHHLTMRPFIATELALTVHQARRRRWRRTARRLVLGIPRFA
jgi:hypothetical protein